MKYFTAHNTDDCRFHGLLLKRENGSLLLELTETRGVRIVLQQPRVARTLLELKVLTPCL
jgi:hypothetical protein